jgi:hypothetical protein
MPAKIFEAMHMPLAKLGLHNKGTARYSALITWTAFESNEMWGCWSACSFRWFIMSESTIRWFIVREKHC